MYLPSYNKIVYYCCLNVWVLLFFFPLFLKHNSWPDRHFHFLLPRSSMFEVQKSEHAKSHIFTVIWSSWIQSDDEHLFPSVSKSVVASTCFTDWRWFVICDYNVISVRMSYRNGDFHSRWAKWGVHLLKKAEALWVMDTQNLHLFLLLVSLHWTLLKQFETLSQ